MPITTLPSPPLRSDGPATFADKGDAFMAALPAFVTQANALEANVNDKEASAIQQVTLAANQVALATDQVALATNQAVIATNAANISTAGANFKGLWTSLTGALNKPASVHHSGAFWALNTNLANVATAAPGVSASWTRIKVGADVYPYDNRAALRSQTPNAGDQAIVEGLGLFVWESGSTEPDDDESCFATASGKWLLQAASWDLVDAWQAPDDAARDEFDEDAPAFLHGSATCTVTAAAAVSSARFTGTVTGAAPGDRVIATPPAQLGTDAASTGRLSYHAWVSAADTVSVMLCNASASAAALNAAVQTAWPITVIKS